MTDTPPPGPDDSFGHAASANGNGPADTGPDGGAAGGSAATRDVDRAWAEVGERFAGLGRRIKEQQQRRATPPDAPATDAPAGGPVSGRAAGDAVWDVPEGEATDERPADAHQETGAARQVIDALDEAFSALGDTVRDQAFQQEARGTLNALGAALGATFTELGQQLQQRFDRPEASDGPPSDPPQG